MSLRPALVLLLGCALLLTSVTAVSAQEGRWVSPSSLDGIALSSFTRKTLALLVPSRGR